MFHKLFTKDINVLNVTGIYSELFRASINRHAHFDIVNIFNKLFGGIRSETFKSVQNWSVTCASANVATKRIFYLFHGQRFFL